MSSRPKPQWGHRPEGIQGGFPPSPFKPDFVEEVAQAHGIVDTSYLAAEFDTIAVRKADAEYRKETDISAPNQRAAIKVMIEEARSLLDHLQSADLSTQQTIFSNYPKLRFDHEPDERTRKGGLFTRDIKHLKRLLRGLEAAERALPKTGGRPRLSLLPQACLDLIKLYERTTGRDFERNFHPSATGADAFLTDGAQFVARCALVVFPDATAAELNTAMRNVSKRKGNKRKAELAETTPE